jgi:hypothetical protein
MKDMIDMFIETDKLDIFDRQYLFNKLTMQTDDQVVAKFRGHYCFPEEYLDLIKGQLSYHQVLDCYKKYGIVMNANTITDSDGITIIEKYYSDQKKYAFSFQMMAYISRLKQLQESKNSSIIVTERCLYTDRNIFAKMLYDSGMIEDIEYSIYLKWFDYFINDLNDIKFIPFEVKENDGIDISYVLDTKEKLTEYGFTNLPYIRKVKDLTADNFVKVFNH